MSNYRDLVFSGDGDGDESQTPPQSDIALRAGNDFHVMVTDAYQYHPELFSLSEYQLLKEAKKNDVEFDDTDRRLKVAFWNMYNKAVTYNKAMSISRVRLGICSCSVWLQIIKCPYKLAWFLIPPREYYQTLEAVLQGALARLDDIVNSSPFNKYGTLDCKKAEVILKAVAMIDNRLHGGFVQKNINATISKPLSDVDDQIKTIEDINRELKQLEDQTSNKGSAI